LYQVQVAPLKLNSTVFMASNTASASTPRLDCRNIPPIVWPAQKRRRRRVAAL
jgi:hypothetical protein